MKVLLIEPAKSLSTIGGEDIFLYEPLALEYVAAGVAGDHDVRILDLRLENRLPEVLAEFRPDVVGITAYTVHVNTVRKLFHEIKSWSPATLTVVGGHHATVAPEDFVAPSMDLIVRGEGVFAFAEIVRRFEQHESFAGIAGVAYGKEGRLILGEPPAEASLDAFPRPARALTAGYRSRYFSEWMKPLASMRTSKGCPHRCNFCALWKLTGGRYLKRQPEQVVEELAGIAEPYVFFADDESLVDAARMKTLAQRIKAAGIRKRYFLYGRSDTIVGNPDLLALWREIGLDRVFVGLEAFNDADMARINKGSTIEDNARAVRILQDLDIEIFASLIVRPEFTLADFAACRQYCRDLDLTFASFSVLTPLPGTDFYASVQDQLLTRNYDFFDFIHTVLPTRLPLQEFYAQYYQLVHAAIPMSRKVRLLRRFRLGDFFPLYAMNLALEKRIRQAYLDYPSAPAPA